MAEQPEKNLQPSPLEKIIDTLLENGYTENEILEFSKGALETTREKIKKRAIYLKNTKSTKDKTKSSSDSTRERKSTKCDSIGMSAEQKTKNEFEALKNILMVLVQNRWSFRFFIPMLY